MVHLSRLGSKLKVYATQSISHDLLSPEVKYGTPFLCSTLSGSGPVADSISCVLPTAIQFHARMMGSGLLFAILTCHN
jgi:hypothetical protein